MTMAGPFVPAIACANAAGSIRPWASVATRTTRSCPSPRNCSAEKTLVCASSPISTGIGGAPNSPLASTSQPARRSTAPRAAARHTKFATVAPVTKPTDASRGRSSRSSSQFAAAVSAAAAAGEASWLPAFCPQAEVSQSAATPAGWEAPITQPKKRDPVMARSPGVLNATSSSMTSDTALPCSGVGASNVSRIAA